MAILLGEGIPDCAAPCPYQALNVTICAVASLTSDCLCDDKGYLYAFRDCIRASCSLDDVYVTKNLTWQLCGFQYHSQQGNPVGRVLMLLTTAFFFIARFVSKFLRLSTWGADDATLAVGYDINLASAETFGHYPMTKSPASCRQADNYPASTTLATNMPRQVFFAFEVIYSLSISALKASILFFYLRVFSMLNRTFTVVLWCTHVFNLLFCVSFAVAMLNQCKPFSYVWESWDGRHQGRCIDIWALFISHAAINIALDIWLLLLPVTQILWLNLRKRQKAEILFMFGLGLFITVVSAIRLKVLLGMRSFSDPTYDAFYLHMWSYIELSVGIIVACLPASRQVWRHFVPKFLRILGLKKPQHQDQPRSGDSTRRLKDILFISASRDQPSPTTANGCSSQRTRSC
ncbi:hypothetical protein CCHL11_07313 [Colletotrichum chlorophyti]|uniref:CFEM domain-containing protein n=1 Tax=Colletotrichum chlorophyti TaxID=708187 RepID=A0A1Q8RA70_9PEZI|nr:hypothetical protein CCHL11_07313 [Colletotrichum chlorophyti]